MTTRPYTAQLQAGLGLVQETRSLLELWTPGMGANELKLAALDSGAFPNVTARRLRNVVVECFAPRYLYGERPPVTHLKALAPSISASDFAQILLLHTCRANRILGDFVRQVYWPNYVGGQTTFSNEEAKAFVTRAVEDGKTTSRWSAVTIHKVAGYLAGSCADFGLLERGRKFTRKFLSFRSSPTTIVYLAYDLHFRNVGDNALLAHEDFQLFGMERADIMEELKRLALQGHLVLQSAGDVVRIGWKYPTMEALCDVLAHG